MPMSFSTLFKRIFIFILASAVGLNVYYSYGYGTTAPPAAYTNAPKDCGNCTSCHSGTALKTKSARIRLTGITTGYTPSDTFKMNLSYLPSLSSKGHAYGFELVAIDSVSKKQIGTLIVTDKTNTVINSSSGCSGLTRQYLSHTSSGIKAAAKKNWNFKWVAPSTTTNTVIFYAIINSANGDGSSGGDTILTQEFHYRIAPVQAGFKSNTSVCTGDSLVLTDTSKGPVKSYSWTFQNGSPSTSTLRNPKVAFASSGSDSITLTVTDANSKTSYAKQTITVNAKPTASITVGTSTMCQGDSSLLTASAGSSYLWSNGSSSSSIYVKDSQSYTVTVYNSSGCGTISSPAKVQVNPVPNMSISSNKLSTYCNGDTVILTANPSGLYSYVFNKNKSILSSTGNSTNFIASSSTLSSSDVFTVIGTTSAGCSATSSGVSFKFAPPLSPNFSYLDNKGAVTFSDSTIGTSNRVWNFGDSISGDTSKIAIHYYTKSGTFRATLTVFNSVGCPDTTSMSVTITFTGIGQLVSINEATIYPNPGTDHLTVSINSMDDQRIELVLRDLTGRSFVSMKEKIVKGENNINLQLNDIAPGMYILQIIGKGEIRNFNVVKQ